MLKPLNNSYNITTTLKLEWSATENTDNYDLQLTDDEYFELIKIDEKAISSTCFITESLDSGITYFWRVKAHNDNSEGNWSEIFSFTTDYPFSVSDISNSVFSISPNPASDYIEISFSNKGLQPFADSEEIEIYDVLGNVVWKSTANTLTPALSQRARELRIDISHLPRGVYFIIKIGNRTEKFVKM